MKLDNRKQRKKRGGRAPINRQRLFFAILFVIFIGVIFVGVRFLGSYRDLQNRAEWARLLRLAPQNKGINYLLYGVIEEDEEFCVKEMFFLNFSLDNYDPHIIFIPGNSLLLRLTEGDLVTPEEGGEEAEGSRTVTPYYTPSHFYNEGGAELLIRQVSFLLNAPVHHYLGVNYEGVPAMIDYRGNIPYKGYLVSGDDYLDYFMKGETEEEPLAGALRRARDLLKVVDFIGEEKGFWSTHRALREVSPYLETDLSWKELQEFYAKIGPLFQPGKLVLELPGAWRDLNGDSYFEPDYPKVRIMSENLGKDFLLLREMITVEVLNGCGVAGIAARVGEMLREEGFQVVNIDNADHFDYLHSQVISRLEEIGAAKTVAEYIPGAELFKEPLPDYPVMVTVILGKNYVN